MAVSSVADDRNQRHIRYCASRLALLSAGITPPSIEPSIQARPLSDTHVANALAYTSPPLAAYVLAEELTALSPDLLDLVGDDQITDTSILGLPVPERARPVLRALDRVSNRVLESPQAGERDPGGAAIDPDRLEAAISYSHLALLLAKLLGGRRQCTAANRIPKTARAELNALRDIGVIELERGVYRIGSIALYSSYQLPAPPTRALTNDRDDRLASSGNPADI